MKVFKAAFTALLSLAVIIFAPFRPASASGGDMFAMALTDDVYIYDSMERNSELFALPRTYCVQITQEYDGWYRVLYAADEGCYEQITGYCKKDNLMILEEPPENIYLNYPVDVVLSSGGAGVPSLPCLQSTVTAAFYGNFHRADTSYICLRYNGGFGYVEGEITDYPQNEIPSAPAFSGGNPSNTDAGSSAAPAIVIAAVAVIAVITLIITGKKYHKRQ